MARKHVLAAEQPPAHRSPQPAPRSAGHEPPAPPAKVLPSDPDPVVVAPQARPAVTEPKGE